MKMFINIYLSSMFKYYKYFSILVLRLLKLAMNYSISRNWLKMLE